MRGSLLSFFALAACAGAPSAPAVSVSGVASLDAETSVPSPKKAREMGWPEVRGRHPVLLSPRSD